MKFNLIYAFDDLNKLYCEVVESSTAAIRANMALEASNNGMQADYLADYARFNFLDMNGMDGTYMMQSCFTYRNRFYNVNIVLVYKGEYYIPTVALWPQYQASWDYVITPCLLPVHVETGDTAGLSTDFPSRSWTVDRRALDDFSEDDGLGETLRIGIPTQIFSELIVNPLFMDPQLDEAATKSFDTDVAHLDYDRPLDDAEDAAFAIFMMEAKAGGDPFYTLALHAMERPRPNMEYVCWRLEQAAGLNDIYAAKFLVQLYYEGRYGVEIDYDKAFKYTQQVVRANDTGDPDLVWFKVTCADCYRYGRGVEKDIDAAMQLYASSFPYSAAYFNMACIYAIGEGVDVDMAKASEFYSLAKQNGLVEQIKASCEYAIEDPSPECQNITNQIIKEFEELAGVLASHGDKEAKNDLEMVPQLYALLRTDG